MQRRIDKVLRRFREKLQTIRLNEIERILGSKLHGFEIGLLITCLFAISYTIAFSWHMILQHFSFHTLAWDLGIYDQAMWTTVFKGRLFYYTVELYFVPNGSFFGIHFAPALFLFLPFYAAVPRPETLLVLQSLSLALGALPVYLIGKLKITRSYGILFAACYLMYPLLQGVNCYDFHIQALFPVLALFSLYYLEKGSWKGYFLFVFLSLTVLEQISYIVVFLGVYALWKQRSRILQEIRSRKLGETATLIPLATIAIGIMWFFFAQFIIHSLNPSIPPELEGHQNVAVLGVDERTNIPLYILENPLRVLSALSYDFYEKISYILIAFGPLAFLSFLSPSPLMAALPWLGIALVSNYPPYYRIGFQYSALIVPFVFVSAILGTRKLLGRSNVENIAKKTAILMLVTSIFFCLTLSPLNPLIEGGYPSPAYVRSEITEHTRLLSRIIDLVPQNESILTQDSIFPHVSGRLDAYVMIPSVPGQSLLWKRAIESILSLNTTYVLIDLKLDANVGGALFSNVVRKNEYGLYASADRIYLFRRFYSGEPVLFEPICIRYDPKDLVSNAKIIYDPTSVSGEVLCHKTTDSDLTTFWYGPYDTLAPGSYQATFNLKLSSNVQGHVLTIDVRTQGETLAFLDLLGETFTQENSWQNFTLGFVLTHPVQDIEFRGLLASNATDISLNYIEVCSSSNGQ